MPGGRRETAKSPSPAPRTELGATRTPRRGAHKSRATVTVEGSHCAHTSQTLKGSLSSPAQKYARPVASNPCVGRAARAWFHPSGSAGWTREGE